MSRTKDVLSGRRNRPPSRRWPAAAVSHSPAAHPGRPGPRIPGYTFLYNCVVLPNIIPRPHTFPPFALHFAILSRCDPLLSVSPLVTSRVRLRIRTAAHTFLVLCAASLLCAAAWDGFFRVPAGPVLRPPPLDRARARPLAAGYARQRTFTGIPALCRCGATMMRSVLLLFLLP